MSALRLSIFVNNSDGAVCITLKHISQRITKATPSCTSVSGPGFF